ncbi:hypothetical protein [Hominiventricola filiformis]|uniref:Uncharacterized protein n=1 Tax=Hominiventricola filiformis TaxID=2885352 RepID=A0AAE3ACS6_9FIRM|nr:hypothetical protein [Hominiventricola filiformis]MCC2127395.1 hypothetical protein [Hominiventricola filiformis]
MFLHITQSPLLYDYFSFYFLLNLYISKIFSYSSNNIFIPAFSALCEKSTANPHPISANCHLQKEKLQQQIASEEEAISSLKEKLKDLDTADQNVDAILQMQIPEPVRSKTKDLER